METTQLRKKPIGELVREDYRTAEVLSRWKLDYCCGGKRNLEDACNREGANVEEVTRALELVLHNPPAGPWITIHGPHLFSLITSNRYITNTSENHFPFLLPLHKK
ncbi:MAG: DUF542 domain-containing protein [Saprospiraceae bacterium]|nr:DUF542 domain-containing protein [Saprospiraceae bacterium]